MALTVVAYSCGPDNILTYQFLASAQPSRHKQKCVKCVLVSELGALVVVWPVSMLFPIVCLPFVWVSMVSTAV